MIRLLILILLLTGAALGLGYAARWQMPGLLNVLDRVWPGPAGQMVAEGEAYGPSSFQQVDVFVPDDMAADERRPVIIFFHGGGWVKGSRDTYGFAGRAFAAEGFVTVVAGYRLADDGRWPVFMEDATGAVRWTIANIARFGGDPTRIVLAGHSAGGHIAVLSALDPRWLGDAVQPGGAVRGAIGLSGPYDFLPFDPGGRADVAMGHARPLEATQPIRFVRPDAPALMLIHGETDTTVRPRNPRALQAAFADIDAGDLVTMRIYPGVDHEGVVTPLSLPFRDRAPVLSDAVAFARRVTR